MSVSFTLLHSPRRVVITDGRHTYLNYVFYGKRLSLPKGVAVAAFDYVVNKVCLFFI